MPCRPAGIRWFRRSRWQWRITLFLAFVVLFAGFAQAAHYHKDDLGRGSTHVRCLLCLFATSSATPPHSAPAIPRRAPRFCSYRCSITDGGPLSSGAALYDARGPPPT
jgi:hypothetical protein